ncbi:MAG: IPT/TIG domain-containing protein [Armatimonadetes bacterium]|nr:hypothetical protein [Armatimonadota bacterium]MBS1700595.1 IPT/TIG domain-containing protein [Armatimonadota bacterium]
MKSKTIRFVAAAALFATLVACGEGLLGTSFTPAIASLNPTSGAVGSSVSIFGTFLSTEEHVPYNVTFNGTAVTSATYVNDTEITVVVPTGATTGPVVVTNPNGTNPLASNSITFTVTTSN